MTYMASLVTVRSPDPRLFAEEDKRFKELQSQRVILAAYLARDRKRGWMVVQGESLEQAKASVESLPLAQFWQIELTELLLGGLEK